MSCFVDFFLIPESKRDEFVNCVRDQTKIVLKPFLFFWHRLVIPPGVCEISTYLEQAAMENHGFPFSGWFVQEYLYCYLANDSTLDALIQEGTLDDNCLVIAELEAQALLTYMKNHSLPNEQLRAFVESKIDGDSEDETEALMETHRILVEWFERVTPGHFGVLYFCY